MRPPGGGPARGVPDLESRRRPALLDRHRRPGGPPLRPGDRPRRAASGAGTSGLPGPHRHPGAAPGRASRAGSGSSTGTSGAWRDWIALEPEGLGNRLNDGRCDPAGRFWVGSMFDPAAAGKATGLLHRVEPDGTAVTVRSGIGVANGLAFAPDGRTMYFADTHRDLVWAYDYDVDTGRGHQRTGLPRLRAAAGPAGRGVPSTRPAATGSRASWAGRSCGSRRPARSTGGSACPVEKPTMPAFGGPDLLDPVHHDDRRRRLPRGRPGPARGRRPVRGRRRRARAARDRGSRAARAVAAP